MDQSAILSAAKYFVVAGSGFGALLLVAVAVRTALKWRLAVTIGAATGVLMNLQGDGRDWLTLLRDTGLAMVAGPAALVAVLGVIWLIDKTRFKPELHTIRVLANPHVWQEESKPVEGEPAYLPLQRIEPLTQQDIVRRWFVTVAAAVGSVVFTLFAGGEFWTQLFGRITPQTVAGAAFIVVVATVLIGPIQEFILDRSIGEDGGRKDAFAESLTRLLSRRSALRLLLVFALALVLLEMLSGNLQDSIAAGASQGTLTILLASITPAIVSYYWSAALQLGVPRHEISLVTSASSTTSCALASYVFGVGLCVSLGLQAGANPQDKSILLVPLAPFAGIFVAALMGYMTAGIYARFGGWVLERMTGWPAMGALGVALLAGAVVHYLFSSLLVFAITGQPYWDGYLHLTLGAVGWLVGLIASGFPRIVMNYPQVTQGTATPALAKSSRE
ncbi:MAG: hypothetical protein VX871_05915 [Pseudomonadota bacterium]|nr:hypothetical protein [Pseudomonadota bacterium]